MKRTVVALLLGTTTLACGGSSGPPAQLLGAWLYVPSGSTSGLGLSFKSDGSFSLDVLSLTSNNSANAQEEIGKFSATDSQFTLMPSEATCPGTGPATVPYTVNGSELVITTPTEVVGLTLDTVPVAESFTLVLGCFQSDGTFVAEPLGPAG